jgi:hypothetical protein
MISEHSNVPSKQGSASSGWIVLDYGKFFYETKSTYK